MLLMGHACVADEVCMCQCCQSVQCDCAIDDVVIA